MRRFAAMLYGFAQHPDLGSFVFIRRRDMNRQQLPQRSDCPVDLAALNA